VRYGTVVGEAGVDGKEGTGLLGGMGKGMSGRRRVAGRAGGLAVIVGFATAVMTFSKTVLYCECTRGQDEGRKRERKEMANCWQG
jgi:hypothetical protein